MIYSFGMQTGAKPHKLYADLKIADEHDIELVAVFMERGKRSRRLPPKVEAEVEDHLVEHTREIIDQWKRDADTDAADSRRDD